jgi:hypothetical protein
MQKINIVNYQDYFRGLAVAHQLLKHDPSSETGDAAVGSKRFARWSVEELVSGLRTKVSFPALLLENYEVVTSENGKYDIKGKYMGAITVLAHATPGDFSSETAAFNTAETILYDILNEIWQHHYGKNKNRCDTPFAEFYFDLNIVPVGPILDNEFGWRAEFMFKPRITFDVTTLPAEGTFIYPENSSS